jgi:parallel beta-helix repeat protein
LIEETNYRDEFGGTAGGGIKLLSGVDVVIRNNLIRGVSGQWGYGIWLDFSCQGFRVTGNVILNTQNAGIFLERNHGPILVDNNVMIEEVIRTEATSAMVVVHNLFYKADISINPGAKTPVYWVPHTLTQAGSGTPASIHEKIYNNIFIYQGLRLLQGTGNAADYNVFLEGARKSAYFDSNSVVDAAATDFSYTSDTNGISISFNVNNAPFGLACPLITNPFIGHFPLPNQGLEYNNGNPITIDKDFYGNARNVSGPTPGPFEDLKVGANSYILFPADSQPTVAIGPKNHGDVSPKRAVKVLTIFPNPVKTTATISFDKSVRSADIAVYDVGGRKVFSSHVTRHISHVRWNADEFAAGLYAVQVKIENTVYCKTVALVR